ncbi:diguanylate cyclase (GGDEF)-like protein/PAS domain S-box-containing protein [Oxalobacteraceae bacterium GrIS 2.11]
MVTAGDIKNFSYPYLSADEIKEHFKALVRSSDDAIISKTISGIVTSWNKGAEKLFGYSADEMVGNSTVALYPNDRLNEESFILDLIIAGEKIEHFDTVRIHKNGKLVDTSIAISPIRDSFGMIIGSSMIARDVSKRKQLESAQTYFKAIVEHSGDAIIGLTLEGKVHSWNKGAETVFGYSASEMLGQSFERLLPSGKQDEDVYNIEQLKKGEKLDHLDLIRICKDGRPIAVSITTSAIRDINNRIVGLSKIARDITDKKHHETHLQLTSSVFTNTNEGILITDSKGTILEVNDSFLRISGYTRDEVLGQTPEMFRSSRHDPKFFNAVRELLMKTGTYQGEAWSRRKDGTAYASLLTINLVKDDAGEIKHYVSLISDITPLRKKQEQMEHLAHFDALTDLPNRILLADRLHQAVAQVSRHKQSLAVLYLDLDYFKEVNDRHGHNVGDQLLITVSQRMKEALRTVDTLARIGGDEFVAVLVDVGTAMECNHLAERILLACAEPVLVDGHLLQVSASIGMTIYPQDNTDVEQLLRHADMAMYEAKQAGRNRVHIFDAALDIQIKNRSLQLSRITQAFDTHEFVLYYQPKVNMRLGTVLGAEALIRWRHPQRGILPPSEFLPLIENHCLELSLGYWVIETALAQISAWAELGLKMAVSVNISPNLLLKSDFVETLSALLAKFANINPSSLGLEIVETSDIHDIAKILSVIQRCQHFGVSFSLDDFGTGYSSLTYLKRLPAETLKIDQSFVRDILIDREDLAIVKGVIALGHAFKRMVIAEGVENIEIGEKLLDLGCDFAQGFGIDRPMPGDEFPAWVASWAPHDYWKNRAYIIN